MAEHNKLENRYWVKKIKIPKSKFYGKTKTKKENHLQD